MTNLKGHTLLLIDDEPDILEFLSYSLKKEGFKIFTASNGEEGVRMAQQVSPSLILLDVMMPVMDGIETCQIIRKDLNITQPIIAFLTSRAEDYSQIAGFEAGADDYITKPIRPRLLISKVESLLRRLEKPVQTQAQSELKSNHIQIDREKFMVKTNGANLLLPKKCSLRLPFSGIWSDAITSNVTLKGMRYILFRSLNSCSNLFSPSFRLK